MERVRRPTADDRRLADVIRNLTVGRYSVAVTNNSGPFGRLPSLKCEGSFELFLDGKCVEIVPE